MFTFDYITPINPNADMREVFNRLAEKHDRDMTMDMLNVLLEASSDGQ